MIGVVVVTYNSAAHVTEALRALDRSVEVVVVDNGSADDTVAVVERLGVRVVRETNRGFGAGCNAGAAALPHATRLLFLNPDAVLRPGDLRTLVAYLDAHPRCALVAPRMTSHGEPAHAAGALATARSELRYLLPHRIGSLLPDRRLPPSYATSGPVGVGEGACMLADAAAFREVGGFDESYFLFFEEHDLAQRLRRNGREVHLCAEAVAEHAVGGSRDPLPMAGRAHYYASAVRYLRRWRGTVPASFLTAVALAWWAVAPLLGRMSRADARALRKGLLSGWRR